MQLEQNEQILRHERMHPAVFVLPSILLIALLTLSAPLLLCMFYIGPLLGTSSGSVVLILLVPDLLVAMGAFAVTYVGYANSEVILTNERLVYRTGFIVRTSGGVPLRNIESTRIFEPLLGRLFTFGTVTIATLGGANYRLLFIPKCQVFEALLQKAITAAQPTARQTPLQHDDSRYMQKFGATDPARAVALPSPPHNIPESSLGFGTPELQPVTHAGKSILALVLLCVSLLGAIAIPALAIVLGPSLLLHRVSPTPVRLTSSVVPQVSPGPITIPSFPPAPQPGPALQETKSLAEAGDRVAQDKLGDIYRSTDTEQALFWYRKAASQGVPNAQYQLAHILLEWANSPAAKPEAAATHVDEAIPSLVKAANQGVKMGQVELGQLYREGKFVTKDIPEAYKWLALAANDNLTDFAGSLGKTYRDALLLKMSQAEIAEATRRIAGFRPGVATDISLPEPAFVGHIVLNGITGVPPRALAIINGKTLAPGEHATVKVDSRSINIHCLSITANSATITVDGLETPKELRLR